MKNKVKIFICLIIVFEVICEPKIDIEEIEKGNWIVFEKDDIISGRLTFYLCLIKAEKGTKPIKLTSGRYRERNPMWSGDGKRIYFIQTKEDFDEDNLLETGLYVLDLSTGEDTIAIEYNGKRFSVEHYCVQRRKDGRDIIFFKSDFDAIIYMWDTESLTPLIEIDDLNQMLLDSTGHYGYGYNIYDIDVSLKYKILVFSCELWDPITLKHPKGGSFIIYDLEKRKIKQLLVDTLIKVYGLSFDNTGQYLAIQEVLPQNGTRLLIRSFNPDSQRTIIEHLHTDYIGWTPDNQNLAFVGFKPGSREKSNYKTWIIDLNGNVLYGLNFAGKFDWSSE